ncbi:hypothetical protein MKY83_13335 [Bacillus sp. FSL M8-0266]|uniref:hypothetical protein n=1 Tax=Bacillus TaxID=1386 RepID=UPI001C24DAD4|nr:hypothetical protein [Bacillus pumilus]MBU8609400.1 hypothetical protein [Bacillus pumilus]MED1111108.1 hypothetical protein [Bacillus pumilus]
MSDKNKTTPAATDKGVGGSAAVKKWVAQAISITGISPSYAKALETIAMKESNGNPTVDDERMQAEQLLNDINSGNISINEARSVLGLPPLANIEANLKYIAI